MSLGYILYHYEDEVICDLLEVYHVLDYKSLPASLVATLVLGLRSNSRVMMAIADKRLSLDQMALIGIWDCLKWIQWSKTKKASEGLEAPKPLLSLFIDTEEQSETVGFESGDAFMEAWAKRK